MGNLHKAALLIVALVVSSCSVTLDAEDAIITCETAEDCPAGRVCKIDLGFCAAEGNDTTPPVITGTISHPVLGANATLTVTVTVDETLLVDPTVQLWREDAAIEVPYYSGRGLGFMHVLEPKGDEPQGEWVVRVRAVDAFGNEATTDVGDVRLDFSPPELAAVEVTPTLARPGVTVTVELTTVEELESAGVALPDGTAFVVEETGEALLYRFLYETTGDEADGCVTLFFELTDLVGNLSQLNRPEALCFDSTPPTLDDWTVNHLAIGAGGTLSVELNVSEPLDPSAFDLALHPAIGDPIPLTLVQSVGNSYVLEYTILQTDDDGDCTLRLDAFTDVAGNAGDQSDPLEVVRIDNSPPVLSNAMLSGGVVDPLTGLQLYSDEIGYDIVTLTFDSNEDLDVVGSLEVVIGAETMICDPFESSSPSYTCRLTVTSGDGVRSVTATAVDGVANRVIADLVSLRIDTTDPNVVDGSDFVSVQPPPGSVLYNVGGATLGAPTQLSFVVDELVPAVSVETLDAGGLPVDAGLVFERTSLVNSIGVTLEIDWVSTTSPIDSPPGDPYAFRVTLTDAAGNSATRDLGGASLVVDTQAPVDPLVATPGMITFHRAPWGNRGSPGAGEFLVHGLDTAVEDDATVIVYADEAGNAEMTRAQADGNGAFDAVLLISDRQTVSLAAVDGAGNRSGVMKVLDIAWTATMSGKQVGSILANPHSFEEQVFATGLLYQNGTQVGTGDGLDAPGGATLGTTGVGAWREMAAGGTVVPNLWSSIVYDAARGELVLAGGRAPCFMAPMFDYCDENGLWRQGGNAWRVDAPTEPWAWGYIGRRPVAFDVARDRLVLGPGSQGRVWELDANGWQQIVPGAGPGDTGAMAYDEHRGVMVVYSSNGTWEWRGTSWQQVCTAAPCTDTVPPLPGSWHDFSQRMFYDPANQRMLLWADGQVWSYQPEAWTPLCTGACATGGPAAREYPALAFDRANGRLVLFGGHYETNDTDCWMADELDWRYYRIFNDTWSFDGAAWTLEAGVANATLCGGEPASPTAPLGGYGPSLGYDPSLERVVMVEGAIEILYHDAPFYLSYLTATGQSWTLGDGGWLRLAAPGPGTRSGASAVYFEPTDSVVMYGGSDNDIGSAQTWVWQKGAWQQFADGPDNTTDAAMAYDPNTQSVLSFGGADWSNNGVLNTRVWTPATGWTQPAFAEPAMFLNESLTATMFYDPIADDMKLVGTGAIADGANTFWHWGATGWEAAPLPGMVAGMTITAEFDVARGVAVLVAGEYWLTCPAEGPDSIWEWDPAAGSWTEIIDSGLWRLAAPSTYDAARGRVILSGGYGSPHCIAGPPNAPTVGLHEWDGAQWDFVIGADAWGTGVPVGLQEHVFEAIGDTGKVLVQGGRSHDGVGSLYTLGDTWLYDTGAKTSPAHVMTVEFGVAGAPADAEIVSFDLDWVVGGAGNDGTVDQFGATYAIWDGVGWRATNAASGTAPTDTTPEHVGWSSTTEATWGGMTTVDFERMLKGTSRQLSVAATPNHPTGRGDEHAVLVTDFAEVTVRYRLTAP